MCICWLFIQFTNLINARSMEHKKVLIYIYGILLNAGSNILELESLQYFTVKRRHYSSSAVLHIPEGKNKTEDQYESAMNMWNATPFKNFNYITKLPPIKLRVVYIPYHT